MAFSTSHAAQIGLILECVVIISAAFASEASAPWPQFNGPYALIRLKRAPQRAFTFSGFNPNNGITALATSADYFPPYYNYQSLSSLTPSQYSYASGAGRAELESPPQSLPPASSSVSDTASSDYLPDYQRPTSEYPIANPNNDDRSLPPATLTPPSEEAPIFNYNAVQSNVFKKKPYKPNNDDDDDDDSKSNSKSSSSASFNAWFPIVLGMYPSSRRTENSNTYKEDVDNGSGKNQYPERYTDRESGGNTVIANSVSHGKSSVASSHAIAYGGEPAMKSSYRKGNNY